MRKLAILFIFPVIFLLSGCLNDPIQDDLVNYSNKEMEKAYDLENNAVSAYESVSGVNYSDDQTMYDTLTSEVIPNYNEFIKVLNTAKIETDELKEIHEIIIKGADLQYNGFVKIVFALENQDPTAIEEANGMLEEARKHLRNYRNKLDKLAKEHNVVWEEE